MSDLIGGLRLLVCGDRDWNNREFLYATLDAIHAETPIVCIVEGEARGADRMAREWAVERGIAFDPYPANWDKYGPAAGPIRNGEMLVNGRPQRVVAFHNDYENSRGTKDMVEKAKKAHVPHEVYREW